MDALIATILYQCQTQIRILRYMKHCFRNSNKLILPILKVSMYKQKKNLHYNIFDFSNNFQALPERAKCVSDETGEQYEVALMSLLVKYFQHYRRVAQ